MGNCRRPAIWRRPALADDQRLPSDNISGGSLPGGNLPGGSLPGGSLPGGNLPGGNLPGGNLPISNPCGGKPPGRVLGNYKQSPGRLSSGTWLKGLHFNGNLPASNLPSGQLSPLHGSLYGSFRVPFPSPPRTQNIAQGHIHRSTHKLTRRRTYCDNEEDSQKR